MDAEGAIQTSFLYSDTRYLAIPARSFWRPESFLRAAITIRLLATEAGVSDNPPLARVHLSDGRWLTLRAARIGTAQPAHARDIAVSIEPAAPGDGVSVFVRASGLTPRETELLRQLVARATTRDIARHMFVSEHTVQDHFKSIFTRPPPATGAPCSRAPSAPDHRRDVAERNRCPTGCVCAQP